MCVMKKTAHESERTSQMVNTEISHSNHIELFKEEMDSNITESVSD